MRVVLQQPDGVVGGGVQDAGGGGQVHPELLEDQDVLEPEQLLLAVVAPAIGRGVRRREQADGVVVAQGAARDAGFLRDLCNGQQ
ncbi:MAG: hypothetical protein NVV57_09435 [Demequina sp.]|nr:hypothetical protein [Demequina sp.]